MQIQSIIIDTSILHQNFCEPFKSTDMRACRNLENIKKVNRRREKFKNLEGIQQDSSPFAEIISAGDDNVLFPPP